ncbi:extracellular solute-binding protein, partial [Streptomyces bacillaris]|uniref:extracellular solute-binding protein n=1 Tax=Streptomyces bacillaris TaxID=68179 RepID=UPI0036D90EEB
GGDRPGYDTIVKDFNASHPNIHVNMTVQPWDTIAQKLPSAWLTGQGPDIAAPSSDPNAIAQYVKTNSVLAITNTGSGDTKINTDQLAPGTVKEFTYDGKLYAVPANFATLSLYYNKKAFAAAGIANPPSTVAELQDDAKKLTLNGGQTQ